MSIEFEDPQLIPNLKRMLAKLSQWHDDWTIEINLSLDPEECEIILCDGDEWFHGKNEKEVLIKARKAWIGAWKYFIKKIKEDPERRWDFMDQKENTRTSALWMKKRIEEIDSLTPSPA